MLLQQTRWWIQSALASKHVWFSAEENLSSAYMSLSWRKFPPISLSVYLWACEAQLACPAELPVLSYGTYALLCLLRGPGHNPASEEAR